MSENDLEIDYARRLSALLRDIRRDLPDARARAVLGWALEREGMPVALFYEWRPRRECDLVTEGIANEPH